MAKLALALGCTLAGISAMSAAEFAFWVSYHLRHGLPTDRLEAATAIAGSYVGGVWGGEASPGDLIPRFGSRRPGGMAALVAYLSGVPGAVVRRALTHGQQ